MGTVERADVTLAGDIKALRVQARLRLGEKVDCPTVDVLLYLPKSPWPAPVFLSLNFRGTQSEHPDHGIRITDRWVQDNSSACIVDNCATERSRGTSAQRWPVEQMLAREPPAADDHPAFHPQQSPPPKKPPAGAIVKPGSVTACLKGKIVRSGLAFTEPRSPYTPYRHGVTEFLKGIEK